jgi:hypothetical protein
MQTLVIVEREILVQALFQPKNPCVLVQVDVLALDGTPEPFDEDVVQCAATTIHIDANSGRLQS